MLCLPRGHHRPVPTHLGPAGLSPLRATLTGVTEHAEHWEEGAVPRTPWPAFLGLLASPALLLGCGSLALAGVSLGHLGGIGCGRR